MTACLSTTGRAQFYNGSQQEFGKNRVQYEDFLWQYYRFDRMETYFYKGGRDVARYVALSAHKHMKELEKEFDFTVDDRLQFIVYNSLTDFRQSNIGVTGDETYNIGGVTRIVGTKIFVYNEGDHSLLDRQVRTGIAQVLLDQMMYGGNWKEVLKNSTLLNLPEWYSKGIVAYTAGPWDAMTASRIRDGVLSGRYDKFNRLEGEEAAIAGRAIWSYVADVYGPSVIPNILYMTRVSRNAESGFLFVLGVSLKTLTKECLEHYKARFAAEDRERDNVTLEELPIRTRTTRTYSQFKLSPDGRYAAWVSNELGQYKVWLYDIAEKKTRRLIKGEQKLNRIVDRSFPVLAWHPSSRALSFAVERKGELYLKTYTLDDHKVTTRPVFMLEKILSMAYSEDGKNIVFSGVREGKTDLYLYYVVGNRQEQLTDDHYDDLDPPLRGPRAIDHLQQRPPRRHAEDEHGRDPGDGAQGRLPIRPAHAIAHPHAADEHADRGRASTGRVRQRDLRLPQRRRRGDEPLADPLRQHHQPHRHHHPLPLLLKARSGHGSQTIDPGTGGEHGAAAFRPTGLQRRALPFLPGAHGGGSGQRDAHDRAARASATRDRDRWRRHRRHEPCCEGGSRGAARCGRPGGHPQLCLQR
jgi:hypothetical protein